MGLQKIGTYAFLAGILISIIFGLIPSVNSESWVAITLIILGLIVGLLNIEDRNISLFLISSIAFVVTSTSLSALPVIGNILNGILTDFVQFVTPAALVVSIVAIIRVSNSK